MANITDLFGSMGWDVLTWALVVFGGLIVITLLGSIGWWAYKKKKWNLRVEIKFPRSDGKLTLSEGAKGHYDANAGIVDIKRKKMKAVGMRPFDVREYLQGSNFLEVMQVGVKQYIPLHPKSYEKITVRHKFKDKKTKQEVEEDREYYVMKLIADVDKRKTWKTYFERVAKDRFTLVGFLSKHWRAIEISIIMFIMFLGFSILWMRMPSICG